MSVFYLTLYYDAWKHEIKIISLLEKDEQIIDICRNVRLTRRGMHTICDNGCRIKESAKYLGNIIPTI